MPLENDEDAGKDPREETEKSEEPVESLPPRWEFHDEKRQVDHPERENTTGIFRPGMSAEDIRARRGQPAEGDEGAPSEKKEKASQKKVRFSDMRAERTVFSSHEAEVERRDVLLGLVSKELTNAALKELITTEEAFADDLAHAGKCAAIMTGYLHSKPNASTLSLTEEERQRVFHLTDAMKKMHALQSAHATFLNALKKYLVGEERSEGLIARYEALGRQQGDFCKLYEQVASIVIPASIQGDPTLNKEVGAFGIESLMIKPVQNFQKLQLKLKEVIKSDPKYDELKQLNEKVLAMQSSVNAQMPDRKGTPTGDVAITLSFGGNKSGRSDAEKWMREAQKWLSGALRADIEKEPLKQKALTGLTLPAGWNIAEEKKNFVIKKGTMPIWQVKMKGSSLTIEEVKRGAVPAEEYASQLALLHQFTQYLNNHVRGEPVLVCPDFERMKMLKGLSEDYQIGKKEKQSIATHSAALQAQPAQTVDKNVKELALPVALARINGMVALNDELIRQKFQSGINEGFIPHFHDASQYSGEIEIANNYPAVAIKQYQAALVAGFEPEFSEATKKQVQAYVRQEVKAFAEQGVVAKQIKITGTDPGFIRESLLEASNNGLIAQLDESAENALRGAFQSEQVAPDVRYNASAIQSDTVSVLQFREMAKRGILPNIDDEKGLAAFRQKINRIGPKTKDPLIINSGHPLRDMQVVQYATRLGMAVQVADPTKVCESVSAMDEAPSVDLTKMPAAVQAEQVRYFAGMGVKALVSRSGRQPIEIETLNGVHAGQLYTGYLNQGFEPRFKVNAQAALIRELRKREYEVDSPGEKDPAVLFHKVSKLMAVGFTPRLDESQKQMLRQYVDNQRMQIPLVVSGYRSEVLEKNQALARELGLDSVLDSAALAVCAEEQREAKRKGEPLPEREIHAFKDKKGKVEIGRTLENAVRMLNAGYAVKLSKEVSGELDRMAQMTVGQKSKKTMKAAQVEALKLVQIGNSIANKNEENKHRFNSGEAGTVRQTQPIEIMPVMKQRSGFLGLARGKPEIDIAQTLKVAQSLSQSGFTLVLPKALEGIVSQSEIDKLNRERQAHVSKWESAMGMASQEKGAEPPIPQQSPVLNASLVQGDADDWDDDDWEEGEDLEAEQQEPPAEAVNLHVQLPAAVVPNAQSELTPPPPPPPLPQTSDARGALLDQIKAGEVKLKGKDEQKPLAAEAPKVGDRDGLMAQIRQRGELKGKGLKGKDEQKPLADKPKSTEDDLREALGKRYTAMHDEEPDSDFEDEEEEVKVPVKRRLSTDSNDSGRGSGSESDEPSSPTMGRPGHVTFAKENHSEAEKRKQEQTKLHPDRPPVPPPLVPPVGGGRRRP